MKAWRVVRFGSPSEALSLDEVDEPVPTGGQVLVRPSRTVLNYNEVDGCRGRYLTINPPIPYTLGMEVVGSVVTAGPGAEEWIGRRVMATATGAFGGHAELVVCDADMTFDAPPALDDTQAAAFFFPFHLAWLGLHERGRLQRGETVLVHAAAGGVGSAAVQLAVASGARVIATCGGEKAALARRLGAHTVIDYRAGPFASAVIDATGGAGVDLVFDGVGGDVTAQSLSCLRRGGRLMIVGFAGGIDAEEVASITPRQFCFGQFDVGGVLLSYRTEPIPVGDGINVTPRSVGDAIQAQLLDLLASGSIEPQVGRVFPFEEVPAALDAMESRQTTGRVVIDWER